MEKFDVAVIGAGVVGALTARELTRYGLTVAVAESTSFAAGGASRANSGIVHAGFDAVPGTLKAKFNALGNVMMQGVCEELGVKFSQNGSIVLAEKEEDLAELLERGKANGVKGLSILGDKELRERESAISDKYHAALFAPTGGIVCPYGLTIAALGNAMDNGAKFFTDFRLTGVVRAGGYYELRSEKGETIAARYVVNSAGAGSAEVAALFGDRSFRIGFRKGEYMLLDKNAAGIVKSTIFTLPTKAGKGILVSPTADNNVIVGPTSVEEEEYSTAIRRSAFDEIRQKAADMITGIPFGEVITSFAGVRVYSDRHDFVIEESKAAENLFNLAGIESPGLTSAPAIAVHVAGIVAAKLGAKASASFSPRRRSDDWFRELTAEEKNAVIAREPEYGRIVCRCEEVTLGEILYAINTNPRATTLDAIKLRTRAQMGRCQGGFCSPHILKTLATALDCAPEDVTKKGGKSNIILKEGL